MRKFLLATALLAFLFPSAQAQDLAKIRKQMRQLDKATIQMGGGYCYTIRGASMEYINPGGDFDYFVPNGALLGDVPPANNPAREVFVPAFQLSAYEVTNLDYRTFLANHFLAPGEAKVFWNKLKRLEKNKSKEIRAHWQPVFDRALTANALPDMDCWTTDFPFSYNQPLDKNYFWHPAFDNYPVVGVSWEQAQAYCDWLTKMNKADLQARGLAPQAPFRLPTEAEWERAARSGEEVSEDGRRSRLTYPWKGERMWNEKGEYRANIRVGQHDYIDDGHEYTSPVGKYAPSGQGFYDLAGNVAEWTVMQSAGESYGEKVKEVKPKDGNDYQVTKGGSWADFKYGAMVGSRAFMLPGQGHSRVGFRLAMDADN